MKLDVNKPWIAKLVSRHSTKDGCSFIRGIIVHYALMVMLTTFAVLGSALVISSLIGGAYVWVTFPHYFSEEFKETTTYFGTEWWQVYWSWMCLIGGIVGMAVLVLGTLFTAIYFVVIKWFCGRVCPSVGEAIKSIPIPSLPTALTESLEAWHHKFCPSIEIILPDSHAAFVVGAQVEEFKVYYNADVAEGEDYPEVWSHVGEIIAVKVNGGRIDVDVMTPSNTEAVERAVATSAMEDVDYLRTRMIQHYKHTLHIWFDEDSPQYRVAPVEEVSTPE